MRKKGTNPLRHTIPKTLSESIYSYIKKAIMDNTLKPNQKIDENEIADMFQVSRTPVREAVASLAAEGFIEIDHHRQILVKAISRKEINEIYQLIGCLDNLAMDLLEIESINPRELVKLGGMIKKMELAFHHKELERYIKLNIAFHEKIWSHNPNDFLHEVIKFCIIRIQRYSYLLDDLIQDTKFFAKSSSDHKEILRSLKTKDKRRLKAIASKHWEAPSSLVHQ